LGDGVGLGAAGVEPAAQQLGVDGKQPPARHVEGPEVGAEMGEVAGAARLVDRRLPLQLAIRVVAEVVVAGEVAYRQPQLVVQSARGGEGALVRRTVERYVAGVGDKDG